MEISELKQLEGKTAFFKSPYGDIIEIKIENLLPSERMVKFSFNGTYLTGFAGEFFKTREDAKHA